jgi:SAM-dependent methyltransferase
MAKGTKRKASDDPARARWLKKRAAASGKARLKPGFSGAANRGAKEEYSSAPPELVTRLHKRFGRDMGLLLEHNAAFQNNRKKNLEAANALQRKMKHGSVTVEDFGVGGEGALWGYVKRKMTRRALLSFEALRGLVEAAERGSCAARAEEGSKSAQHASGARAAESPAAVSLANVPASVAAALRGPEPLRVASVGGGPGNDLYGFVLFRDLCCNAEGSREREDRLWVMDFAARHWRPIVERVGEVLGRRIECVHCDIQKPLVGTSAQAEDAGEGAQDGPQNGLERPAAGSAAEAGSAWSPNAPMLAVCNEMDLFLFSFVLHEARGWRPFLSQLWERAKPGAVFIFKDPSAWQERQLLSHFSGWKEGVDYWWILGDGLVAVRREGAGAAGTCPSDGATESTR